MNDKQELEKLIEKHLQICDSENYPNLCEMVSTPEGMEAAKDMIFEYCANNGVSVQTAIAHIEAEL